MGGIWAEEYQDLIYFLKRSLFYVANGSSRGHHSHQGKSDISWATGGGKELMDSEHILKRKAQDVI